jgi:hypothetical protein
MADYETIWLSPDCGGAEREWCSDNVWDECDECGAKPTEYMRADVARQRIAELERALTALRAASHDTDT